jgi:hypothetical protein
MINNHHSQDGMKVLDHANLQLLTISFMDEEEQMMDILLMEL